MSWKKLLKENLTLQEWEQWLKETPDDEQDSKLSYFINYLLNTDERKFPELPSKLNMTENKNFVKGYLYLQDYILYYVFGHKTIYNTDDMSTEEQLSELGFTERQREFIMIWEETPFYYNTDSFDDFYLLLMNDVIPVSILIDIYFDYIKDN